MNKSDSNDNFLKPEAHVRAKNDQTVSGTGGTSSTTGTKTAGAGTNRSPKFQEASGSEHCTQTKTQTNQVSGGKSDDTSVADDKADGDKHEQAEPTGESTSTGSSTTATSGKSEGHEKVVNMCVRGEWAFLDQQLRNTRRGHASLSKRETVSIACLFKSLCILHVMY